MPIYEYECEKCGERYELLRSMSSNDKDIVCPKCGAKKKAARQISAFGSVFNAGASSCGTRSSGFS